MMLAILGSPVAQGSKRFLGVTKAGKGIIIDSKQARLDSWRSDIIGAVERYRERHPDDLMPYTQAVLARMVFSFLRPKSVSPRKRPYMTTSPDLEKLARGACDALKAAGAIADDCLVVEYTRLAKVYCKEDPDALEVPGLYVVLHEIAPPEQLKGK
jgi:Holliday junction resolvase RusA-like endonuclease